MKKTRKNWTYFWFTVPGFVLYAFFFITPVVLGIYYSLTDWNGISQKYNLVGLENYKKIFQTSQFMDSLSFTFKYTILLIIFVIVLGISIALLLNRNIKGRSFFRAIYFISAILVDIISICSVTFSSAFFISFLLSSSCSIILVLTTE